MSIDSNKRLSAFSTVCLISLAACALSEEVNEQGISTTQEEKLRVLRIWMQRSNSVHSLHEAAAKGNVKEIKERLAEGDDMEQPDELGRTPLFIAAQEEQQAIVELLLNHGADLVTYDAAGRCTLDFYTNRESTPEGKNILRTLKCRENAIAAIMQGDIDALEKCLTSGLNPNSRHKSQYLLQYAIDKGDQKAVEALLRVGATPNIRYADGKSALHIAAGRGLAEIAKLLADTGADPMAKARNGAYPLHDAIWFGKTNVLRVLLPLYKNDNFSPPGTGSGGFPVVMAISMRRTEALREFLEQGLQVNDPRFAQEPLLICAVRAHNIDAVRLLLEAGADKSARDKEGKQAIDYADESVKELLK